jgi:basic membrane protein A and related proteins
MRVSYTRVVLALALALALAVVAGCGSSDDSGGSGTSASGGSDGEGVRFALVESNAKEDGGWNSNFLRAVEEFDRALPGAESTIVAEVNPGAQAQQTLDTLASQGYNLIAINGNHAPDVTKVAPKYPDVKFLSTYEDKTLPNKGIYGAADEQGGYLNGVLAGSMTRSGTLGYVGSYPFPATKKVIDAFTLGAQSVRPDVRVRILWVNSYYDPTKERQAASALADAGADVLMQDNASPASASVAEQRGLKYVGWAADRSSQAPKAWLGGFNYNWSPIFIEDAKAVAAGNWETGVRHAGLAEGGISIYPFGNSVPQDVQDRVTRDRDALKSGELVVFRGPITDNKGKVVVAEGDAIDTPEALNSCCAWLAQGIQGDG